jgi:hypothetical protein
MGGLVVGEKLYEDPKVGAIYKVSYPARLPETCYLVTFPHKLPLLVHGYEDSIYFCQLLPGYYDRLIIETGTSITAIHVDGLAGQRVARKLPLPFLHKIMRLPFK